MAQNITLLGASYSDVPAVTLPKTGGGSATFTDVTDTTAAASDVASGKYFYTSSGVRTQGTSSGGGSSNDFVVTLTKDQNDVWQPDKTYAEVYGAYQDGKNIVWYATSYETAYGYYVQEESGFEYGVDEYFDDGYNEGIAPHRHLLDSNGVTDLGSPDLYYTTYQANATASDVANGKIFFNANGYQVGTASGGGASNVVQGTFTTGSSTSVEGTFTIPYTGSGYPIMLLVYIDGGVYNNGTGGNITWYNSKTKYAIGEFLITKARMTTTPTYETSGDDNYGVVALIYKNSTSTATTYSRTSTMNANSFTSSSTSANSTNTTAVRFKGNGTTVSYWIGYYTSSSVYQYGLLKDTKYAYIAVYSS